MWKNNGLQGFCGTGKGTDQGLSEEQAIHENGRSRSGMERRQRKHRLQP